MENCVLSELSKINKMTYQQLKSRWQELFGDKPGKFSRNYMIGRLAYRVQELALGGLDIKDKKALEKIAVSKRPVSKKNPDIIVGTKLIRQWHDSTHEVVVTQDGFTYNGKPYRSLSAIANEITGAHWNGRHFFGISDRNRKKQKAKK